MLTESSQTILTLENVQVQEKCFEVLTAKEQGKETQLISYAVVWLTRSKSRNALNTKTLEDLIEAFSFLQTQYHLNVVVLAGKGKSFCAGADLKAGPEPFVPTAREKRYRLQVGRRAIAAIENLEAITIAKVHGHAAGGGLGLVQACDLRIVCENTRMWFPEVDINLPLTWGLTARLVRDLGRPKAMELITMGSNFPAQDAFRLGFVNQVVQNEKELDQVVQKWVSILGLKNASTLHIIKTQFRQLDSLVDLGRVTDSDNDLLLYNKMLDSNL